MRGWHTFNSLMRSSEDPRENDRKLTEMALTFFGDFISRKRKMTTPKGRRNVMWRGHNSWPSLVPWLKGSYGKRFESKNDTGNEFWKIEPSRLTHPQAWIDSEPFAQRAHNFLRNYRNFEINLGHIFYAFIPSLLNLILFT